MRNLPASIHNRVSTLCQAYVKYNYPDVWAKLRQKAEEEYANGQSRRNTVFDLELALKTKLAEDVL